MADLPLPSRADWPMGTLRKHPASALALAGLGVGNGRVALAHVWLGHVHPVGGAWGPAPPAAGPPRAQLTPGPGTFNSIAVMAAAHVGVAAPAHQTSRVLGQTHPQRNAGAAPLARSPSVRPAGRVLERRRDAPRCVASHRDCTASARLGSSCPGSSRSGRDTPHGRGRDRASEQSIAASRDVNAARRPSVSTQGSIEM
jgi:hypothetical protein